MNVTDLEFEYHHTHGLLSYYCRFQRTILSAFWLNLSSFLRVLIMWKRLPSRGSTQGLNPENRCVRTNLYVQLFGCSSAMQAIEKQQTGQQNNHIKQTCSTLTLNQHRARQQWGAQLPSPLESGA